MTNPKMHRIGTVGAMLALATVGGCASWWAPKEHQAASSPPPVAASPPQAVAATKPVVTPDLVKQVQTKLQDVGYYKNQSVDGVWGPRTRSAVQQFQKSHSLDVSGQLDGPTLQAMNIVSPQTDNYTGNTGNNPPAQVQDNASPANPPPQNGTAPANPPPAVQPTNPHG